MSVTSNSALETSSGFEKGLRTTIMVGNFISFDQIDKLGTLTIGGIGKGLAAAADGLNLDEKADYLTAKSFVFIPLYLAAFPILMVGCLFTMVGITGNVLTGKSYLEADEMTYQNLKRIAEDMQKEREARDAESKRLNP
jgi:hypothetical protein